MPDRLSHALRFAVTTLVAVYLVGAGWELFDVFVRGEVADGLTARETFAFNEAVWRVIAPVEAVTVFLLRIGDLNGRPPSWPFAWELAAWLGAASVAVAAAVETGSGMVAAVVVVVAAGVWLGLHRRLPGWPGPAIPDDGALAPVPDVTEAEGPSRELR